VTENPGDKDADQGASLEEQWQPVDIKDASFATISNRPVVPDGKISKLPFPLEYWEDFEKLLVALAIDVDGLADVRRYGTSGQAQDGIDVVGFTRLGHHANAYQCKNVHEFDEDDLTKAIAKFVDGRRPFSPKRLVIAVGTAANRTQVTKVLEDARAANPDLVIELWAAPKLDELLRARPRIVEQFFGEDVARRFCLSASFPVSAGLQPSSAANGVPLEIIMRGPVRSLGFDARFDEAVGTEQSDPAAAAFAFADIADRLSVEGYSGHADALRRRAVQAYGSAGRHSEGTWLQLRVIGEAILAGRWVEAPGMLWLLNQLLNGQQDSGATVDAGIAATVPIINAAHELIGDPLLAAESSERAVTASASHLDALAGAVPSDPSHRATLLVAAGAAIVTIAECAVAAEAFGAVNSAAGALERAAAVLVTAPGGTEKHLATRLRLALSEASSPFAADATGWEDLQREAIGWKLSDRDAALVLARYARARAWGGAALDADAAWQRGVEFGTRARLFADIAGWLSSQVQLRRRFGSAGLAEIRDIRQMITLLKEQPSERIVPIAGVREEVLDELRRGGKGEQMRSAALAAQRMRVLAAAAGLWEDELEAHSFLGDIYERSGEPMLAAFHRIRCGEAEAAGKVAGQTTEEFLDVTPELNRPSAVERSAAYSVLAPQADLIPDGLVNVIGDRALADMEAARDGKIAETGFHGLGILVSAARAAADVVGRLAGDIPGRLMSALDWRLSQTKGTISQTDEPHLRLLVAIAAADDDSNAAEAFERIAGLFAVESPALRGRGIDLAPAVRRRPDGVRKILVSLARQGSDQAAEMLAGWSLTGAPGRDITREDAMEQSAWEAAVPFAEQAAQRLASSPPGTSGSASLIVSFPTDAGLVTILDPADVEAGLTGLLQVAADRLHLAMTRQQALTAASIFVAGDTGNRLGAGRLSEIFALACEYAYGQHDGSAMDDMATWTHPLSAGRVNMDDTSLAADGLHLASRASRTPEEHAIVLSIAAQIVRRQPVESVLNGVGHALAALPSLADAPPSLSIAALVGSPSESLRAVGALHWTLNYAPAGAEGDSDGLGSEFASDRSSNVRRGLVGNLVITASKHGLSSAGQAVADALSDDIHWDIRKAAREARATATSGG
jgi:hypothetical protein